MADIDITLYYNQLRLEAMERYLNAEGKRLEDELYPLVDALYEKLVPDIERGEIETHIALENASIRAEQEAAKRFAVVQLCQGEDDYFLTTPVHRTLYDVAGLYRKQLQPIIGKVSMEDLADRFWNADQILKSDFYRMYYQEPRDSRITAMMIVNFNNGTISVCDNDGGLWTNYALKDISTAYYKAERKKDLSSDERREMFDSAARKKILSFFLDDEVDETLMEEEQTEPDAPAMLM